MVIRKNLLEKLISIYSETDQKKIDENIKQCRRCNSELTVLSRQTRSADEGATTFYRCLKCLKTINKI